jgi:chemotaxis protein methyltransferase CheR
MPVTSASDKIVSNQQFQRARCLAVELAGIELADRHHDLLERRSQRAGIRDSAAMESLLAGAEAGEETASQQLVQLLTTKFTGFFRQPHHFEAAAAHAQAKAAERGSARMWSAAAATGEEPWSLAMAILEKFNSPEPAVRILATDLDAEALLVAQRGEYGESAVRTLERSRRERFFVANNDARNWSVVSELRNLAEFRLLNLVSPKWDIEGPFDVIFCRNVLMYLESSRRTDVLSRIASLTASDGLLMLDPAEHLGNGVQFFKVAGHGIYSLRHDVRQTIARPSYQLPTKS